MRLGQRLRAIGSVIFGVMVYLFTVSLEGRPLQVKQLAIAGFIIGGAVLIEEVSFRIHRWRRKQ